MQAIAILLLQLGTAVSSQDDWRRFSPPDSSFAVTFPGGPQTSEIQTAARRQLFTTRSVYFDDSLRNTFRVSWTEYQQGQRLPRLNDSLVARMVEAFAESRQAVTVDRGLLIATDPHARPAVLRTTDGRTILVRFSMVGNRIYQLVAEVAGEETGVGRARRFLESFQPTR